MKEVSIDIRKAVLDDINELELLYGSICDYLADKEYNPGWRKGCFPTREDALYFLKENGLYVAKTDGKIAGSAALTYSPNGESNEALRYEEEKQDDILYVHVLTAHPDYLRRGIGTELLRFAEVTARKEGLKSIRLYVYEKNYVAIRTYEKNGYEFVEKTDIGLGQLGLDWFCLYEKKLIY